MILDIVTSINGVPVRLNDERWEHIIEEKPTCSRTTIGCLKPSKNRTIF
jgi:hypothetical protein